MKPWSLEFGGPLLPEEVESKVVYLLEERDPFEHVSPPPPPPTLSPEEIQRLELLELKRAAITSSEDGFKQLEAYIRNSRAVFQAELKRCPTLDDRIRLVRRRACALNQDEDWMTLGRLTRKRRKLDT